MSELAELHAEVLLNPEPDEPRLTYANAVQGTDPARAELIRVQIELTRLCRRGAPLLELSRGFARQAQLLDQHKDAWAKPVSVLPGVKWVGFMRGFPEHIKMTAHDFLAMGDAIFARAPVLHLDLLEVKPYAEALFDSPLLSRVHSLFLFRNELGDDEAIALASSPHLSRLRWLDVKRNEIGQRGVEAMAASDRLPALRFVNLDDNPCPSPTPQIAETDTLSNEILHLEIPRAARELEARFGKKPWLSFEMLGPMFPPSRDVL